MDSYSISHTTPSRRASSRIYQDLVAFRDLKTPSLDATIQELMMNTTAKTRNQKPAEPPRVLVIGAGLSGLRCADVLLQNGFNVTIWEARDRVGGRVHQVKLTSGATVDTGANWIHGTDDNPILKIAQQTDTATHDWGDALDVFDENGKHIVDGPQMMEEMWGIVVEAFKVSASETSTIDSEKSLFEFFEEKVLEIFPSGKNAERSRKLVLQLAEIWGAFVGSSVKTQSLKFFWLEECIDGENLFCAGTYARILATIAEPALARARVEFLTKAVQIESIGDTIRVQSDGGFDEEFDEVVATTPLGWLKKNKTVFLPPLPERLCLAIDNIGYGCLEKVYINFPIAFWHEEAEKTEGTFTGHVQFLAPNYATETNPERWTQESIDLSTMPSDHSQTTLLFYIYGDQSIKLAENLSSLPSTEAQHQYLVEFYKPYYSRLPNYVEGAEECMPVDCLATSWVADDLAGNGSYTTMRTGLQEADKDIEVMRAGLPGRSLWFAGEHTAPFIALGTTTGAYLSGEAVANRIAAAYGCTSLVSDVQDIECTNVTKHINFRGFADEGLEDRQ